MSLTLGKAGMFSGMKRCLTGGSLELLVSTDHPHPHDHSHNDWIAFELPLQPSRGWHVFYKEGSSEGHTTSRDSTEQVSFAIFHQGDMG